MRGLLRGILAAALLCAAALPQKARAQSDKTLVRASLLASVREPSAPFEVGIRLLIAPGWHLYWKNPGESGLPIDVEWNLPPGYRVTDIRFPAPVKHLINHAVSYLYEREVVLLCRVEPPAGQPAVKSPILGARLDWLVCKDRCLRGGGEVSLRPSSLNAREIGRQRRMLANAESRIPGPLSDAGVRVTRAAIRPSGKREMIEIAFGGSSARSIQDFYPEALKQYTIHYADISVRKNIVRIPVTPSSEHARLDRINGLAIIDGSAYDVTAEIRGNR